MLSYGQYSYFPVQIYGGFTKGKVNFNNPDSEEYYFRQNISYTPSSGTIPDFMIPYLNENKRTIWEQQAFCILPGKKGIAVTLFTVLQPGDIIYDEAASNAPGSCAVSFYVKQNKKWVNVNINSN